MGRACSSPGGTPDSAWGTRSPTHSGPAHVGPCSPQSRSQRQASLGVSHVHAVVWGCQSRELHCRVLTQHGSCSLAQPRPPLFPVTGAGAWDGHCTCLVSAPRGLSTTQVKLVCRCCLLKELKCRSRCRAHAKPCSSSL